METASFLGLPFDVSRQMSNGNTLHMLVLREQAIEIVIATVWLQLLRFGMLDVVWPGGRPGLAWLIQCASDPSAKFFGCFLRRGNELRIVGLGWASGLTAVADQFKAEVGMVFYPEIQRTRMTHELSDMAITWGFEHMNLSVVYGTIPTPNRLANRFALRMGFHHVGTAP